MCAWMCRARVGPSQHEQEVVEQAARHRRGLHPGHDGPVLVAALGTRDDLAAQVVLRQVEVDDVLPTAQEHRKSVIAVGVFNSGLLSQDRQRDPEQGRRNVELHARRIPDGLWDELRTRGLIRADVPIPSGDGRLPSHEQDA